MTRHFALILALLAGCSQARESAVPNTVKTAPEQDEVTREKPKLQPKEEQEEEAPPPALPRPEPAVTATEGKASGPAPRRSAQRKSRPTLRAGARRLEAYRPGRFGVPYRPDPGVRLPRVQRARGKRRLAAEVGPFEQRDAMDEQQGKGADVAGGAENVARALAAQLHAMGWLVQLVVDGEAGRDGRPGKTEPHSLRFGFRGTVRFWVEDRPAGAKRGAIQCDLQLLDAGGATIHTAHHEAEVVVTKKQQPRVTRRTTRAQSGALRRLIRRVLTDPGLEPALVRAINKR